MTEMKQLLSLKQTLQLVMTPQLQQAIKLLQLSRLELSDLVTNEMTENPVLEVTEELPEGGERVEGQPGESELSMDLDGKERDPLTRSEREAEGKSEPGFEEIDWDKYLENYSSGPPVPGSRVKPTEELPSYENVLTKKTSLSDHLLWQLRLSSLLEREQEIGAQIILNLNADGYLVADDEDRLSGKNVLEEIAENMDVSMPEVERILKGIQNFDPVGVAARNLKESLLIQARHLEVENGLVYAIVSTHLSELERKNFQSIARALKVSKEEVLDAVRIISHLEPRPGRLFTEEKPQYITPDIYVYKLEDDYIIVLNEDGLPKLRISPYYRRALGEMARSGDARSYIQDKLRSAVWLIRSIHQRQRTIYRVTESIVKAQKEFLDKGVAFLKPLVLRDVAEDLSLHESTISRVTTNKYVHTPQGIFELKYFFNSGISRTDGDDVASESVKESIRQIVAAEDPVKPLSDREIVDLLKKQSINIARRTVAKYREMLSILPSSKRKKMF